MSGLIWQGIGNGIANAGSTFGGAMMQGIREDEANARRLKEREEDRKFREEQNALYRTPAGGKNGSFDPAKATAMNAWLEGLTTEEMAAREKEMNTPASKTIEEKIDIGPMGEKLYGDDIKTVTVTNHDFEKQQAAKDEWKAKNSVRKQEIAFGGQYDDITKGRMNQQTVDLTNRAVNKPEDAGLVGRAVAAGKGEGLYGGDSNVTRDKFTGKTTTTDVGKSAITENQAQAGKASSGAKLDDAKTDQVKNRKDPESMKYRQELVDRERTLRTSLNSKEVLAAINNSNKKGTPLPSHVVEAQEELKSVKAQRAELDSKQKPSDKPAAATPKPTDGAMPSPKTAAEHAKLPAGTRYRAPDGSIKIKG